MDNFQSIKDQYRWIDDKEWEWYYKNNKLCLRNLFSGEQFTSQKIKFFSEHVQQIYKIRASHPLPHTPKVILSETQKEIGYLNFLVQRGIDAFTAYLKQVSNGFQSLKVFKELLGLIVVLYKRYGHFRITNKMVKVTQMKLFQVWISQHEESCHREFPLNSGDILKDSKTMVQDLLSLFQGCGHDHYFSFLHQKISKKKSFSFENAQKWVQESIRRKQILLKKNKSSTNFLRQLRTEAPSFLREKNQKGFTKKKLNFQENKPLKQKKEVHQQLNLQKSKSQKNYLSFKQKALPKEILLKASLFKAKQNQKKQLFSSEIMNIHNPENTFKSKQSSQNHKNQPLRSTGAHSCNDDRTQKRDFGDFQNIVEQKQYLYSSIASFSNEKPENKKQAKLLNEQNKKKPLQKRKSNFTQEKNQMIKQKHQDSSTGIRNEKKSQENEGVALELDIERDFQFLMNEGMAMHRKQSALKDDQLMILEQEMANILL